MDNRKSETLNFLMTVQEFVVDMRTNVHDAILSTVYMPTLAISDMITTKKIHLNSIIIPVVMKWVKENDSGMIAVWEEFFVLLKHCMDQLEEQYRGNYPIDLVVVQKTVTTVTPYCKTIRYLTTDMDYILQSYILRFVTAGRLSNYRIVQKSDDQFQVRQGVYRELRAKNKDIPHHLED
jgi:hypothetical protein